MWLNGAGQNAIGSLNAPEHDTMCQAFYAIEVEQHKAISECEAVVKMPFLW